jgi:hypothetical protein
MHVIRERVVVLFSLDLAFLTSWTPLSRGMFWKGYTCTPSDWRKQLFRGLLQILHR